MQYIDDIELIDYLFDLPDERVAKHPLEKRDESKLLTYAGGQITHQTFKNIGKHMPTDATLYFNNTRVIPARMYFQKSGGAIIEVFLLQPIAPSPVIAEVMTSRGECTWKCMIGRLKRWKQGQSLEADISTEKGTARLTAYLEDRESLIVKFTWNNPGIEFVDLVESAGSVPLPPYLNREPVAEDKQRYQTVYSRENGAVAAPTAGLHFTDEVISDLEQRGITKNFLTLHVGAGTFQPIKSEKVTEHPMHSEQIVIKRGNLESLLSGKPVIAVGTTSMRTLESLYWYGVMLLEDEDAPFNVPKLVAYQRAAESLPGLEEAMQAVLNRMEREETDHLIGHTEIFIVPGYTFRVCRGLITNFHLPGSTLILLVAAFIGEDWRKVYKEAMENGYRFLSYGDSSLLLP
ncbi:S-adenosylmethionine:tRNA ribosyltransferase-isomerase [Roseivirga sp. BDSF3-8]|uniref:S-adenosylmethionine:tRNA ribosyltransferase-isomerase n=1 Tax=Roseivirga sp. BDSF3-8 TaxID=3241598 RepID=UPI003532695E